jgi:hypothetical protein
MSSVDFATHADLTGRIRGVIILLDEQLTSEQARSAEELVDASEFGDALEYLADVLSVGEMPIPDDVRRDFERLSSQVGNDERVMGALRVCPTTAES